MSAHELSHFRQPPTTLRTSTSSYYHSGLILLQVEGKMSVAGGLLYTERRAVTDGANGEDGQRFAPLPRQLSSFVCCLRAYHFGLCGRVAGAGVISRRGAFGLWQRGEVRGRQVSATAFRLRSFVGPPPAHLSKVGMLCERCRCTGNVRERNMG